jgi:hypothetical protein
MKRADAREAGVLVEALESIRDLEIELAKLKPEKGELYGLSLSEGHTDAGCTGLGPYLMLPKEYLTALLVEARELLERNLDRLGVDR